jgi:hypothetical protein
MADCELMDKCLFFRDQMAHMPAMAELQKDKYCRGDNSICARYQVFKALGKGTVPDNLFPHDLTRAEKIISAAA